MSDKKPFLPSFRAVEKLGMENPELNEALLSSGIMQLGYDPRVLIQRGPTEKYETTNLYGSYLPDVNKPTRFQALAEEAKRRELDEAVYVTTRDNRKFDRYRRAGYKDQEIAELFELTVPELLKLEDYFSSDDYLQGTMFEEFFHRGMKKMGEDYSNREQDIIMSTARLTDAPEDIKPILVKYIKKKEGGLPTSDAFEVYKELEEKAKKMLERKMGGGIVDKPLYQD